MSGIDYIKSLPPEEKKRLLSKLKLRVRKAMKQIVRSLKNRGFEAYYVVDELRNQYLAVLTLDSMLKVIKRSIDSSIRPFIEVEYSVREGRPCIIFYIDMGKLREVLGYEQQQQ